MEIKNDNKSCYNVKVWKKPDSTFYDALMKEDNWKILIHEAFLVSDVDNMTTETKYSSSGCKYPHHVIKNGQLVVCPQGLIAAYKRACQCGKYNGQLKDHLQKHFVELGLDKYVNKEGKELHGESAIMERIIDENFKFISEYIFESIKTDINLFDPDYGYLDEGSHGKLKYDFRPSKNTIDSDDLSINDDIKESFDWTDQSLLGESADDFDWFIEDGEQEAVDNEPQPEKESKSKQVDKTESDKNGVRRKKLYIAFIEWCKEYNSKNIFGSIFDKDAFNVTYPFVPHEMRYFYRLANPMLCVLAGDLTFFQVAELNKLNRNNPNMYKLFIFAATPNDVRVFNTNDKKVYRGELNEEEKELQLHEELGNSFDEYLQNMIKKGDILNTPIPEKKSEPSELPQDHSKSEDDENIN